MLKRKKVQGTFPLVTIGIPSYRREKMLLLKLKNLLQQTYKKTKIIISLNNKISQETNYKIKKILKKKNYDLYVQRKNLGAWNNFLFVLEKARSPFFMWASDDDYHDPRFIEKLIRPLLKNKSFLAMSGFENVNAHGQKYRKVKQIWEYFGRSKVIQARSVIEDPELFGKANFIYGIWNTTYLKKICKDLQDHICVDQAIVMAGLLSNKISFVKKILFKKTNFFEKNKQTIKFKNPEKGYYFSLFGDRIYRKNILRVLWHAKNPIYFLYFAKRLFLEKTAK